jgi:hypothetical protein
MAGLNQPVVAPAGNSGVSVTPPVVQPAHPPLVERPRVPGGSPTPPAQPPA